MPKGIYERTTNKGWFKKGYKTNLGHNGSKYWTSHFNNKPIYLLWQTKT